MSKDIRKAVRCLLIKNHQIVAIKYETGRLGYFDIPGGKIEKGEHPIETTQREFTEETGLEVNDLSYRGKIVVEYEDRSYDFSIFMTTNYCGKLQDNAENKAFWIDIDDLNNQELKFAWLVILKPEFIDNLFKYDKIIDVKIEVDQNEHIISMSYQLKKYQYSEVIEYTPVNQNLIHSCFTEYIDNDESL